MDCCYTFSASSFVTSYTQSFLHGAVLRRHTKLCFAVYYLCIYAHIIVAVWHSDRLHEAGRGVGSLDPSTAGESTVTTASVSFADSQTLALYKGNPLSRPSFKVRKRGLKSGSLTPTYHVTGNLSESKVFESGGILSGCVFFFHQKFHCNN